LARLSTELGDAGIRLLPGTWPMGIGVPGTLGPKPAGLASGEPGGAILPGACTPGTLAKAGDSPGRAENSAVAMRASVAGSGKPAGNVDSVGWGTTVVIVTAPLYL
jgi:hypothetical protein